ncbi:dynamin family protein [Prevotella melaninogenica]|uniref:dynamin family protein n=1 Tax=Prevotella melaninogenica TaxID=28132 RepID=UPI002432D302|nr:dynamin family protein [Prevotella melaninogenica]
MRDLNDFMKLRANVNKALSQYMQLRKKIDWKDSSKSTTIQQLAQPFLNGYFTIAIAGKMSAGKSTFINSLIGENILPTGHFQTTSGITWIISSKDRSMEVTFADGKKLTYKNHFAEELRKLVAVPEEFDDLPINDINTLIIGNNDINTILQKKAGIEVKTGTSSSEDLWKKYVSVTPKSKIAQKVVIHIPLPDEYEGWRIVDTPGVGAIGGIQETTMQLLTSRDKSNNNQPLVDAVILLHKGTENIQDESANRFAEDVSKSMGELAKGRLFFVLTHASIPEFLNYKDGILSRASNLFGRRLDIPAERIIYVDSFIQRFITDAKKSGKDFSNPEIFSTALTGWTEEDWKAIRNLLSPLYMELQMQGKETSNSTIFGQLETTARFDVLRDKLNDFLNNEKEATFNRLMNLIEDELKLYQSRVQKDIQAVSNGSSEIAKQIKEAEQENLQLNQVLVKLQQKATSGAIKKLFEFVDPELEALSTKKTITEVRAAYLQIIDKGINVEKNYFETLIRDFDLFAREFSNSNLTMKSLDMQYIEQEAQKKATSKVTDYSRAEKRLVEEGGWSSDDKYETYYPHEKDQIDFDRKLREFTAVVKRDGRTLYKAYIDGVVEKCKNFLTITSENVDFKKNNTINRLKCYENCKTEKDKVLAVLNSHLNEIKNVQIELDKFSD